MKNKSLILLLAAAGLGYVIYMQMRRKRGTVSVEDVTTISEREFLEAQPTIQEPSIIEKVSTVTKALFPPKTAEQKAAKKAAKEKAQPSAAPAKFKLLAAAAQAAQKAAATKGKAQPSAAPAKFKLLAAAAQAAQKKKMSGTGEFSVLY